MRSSGCVEEGKVWVRARPPSSSATAYPSGTGYVRVSSASASTHHTTTTTTTTTATVPVTVVPATRMTTPLSISPLSSSETLGVRRGDVVLFPSSPIRGAQSYSVKRVTRLPGDRDTPRGTCWVEGDGEGSLDSRAYGAIPLNLVEAVIIARISRQEGVVRVV